MFQCTHVGVILCLLIACSNVCSGMQDMCVLKTADTVRHHSAEPAIFSSVFQLTNESLIWYTTLFKLTRLFNPTTRILVFTKAHTLVQFPHFVIELANLHIDLRLGESYDFTGSTQSRIRQAFGHPVEVMTRFCDYYVEATRLGLRRILAIDADIALFANVRHIMDYFPEDLVTTESFCSQMLIVNDVRALGNYCQYMLEFAVASNQTRAAGFKALTDVRSGHTSVRNFRDMEMLHLFTRGFLNDSYANRNLYARVICNDQSSPYGSDRSNPSCSVGQAAAVTAYHMVTPNSSYVPWKNFTACKSIGDMMQTITWSRNAQGLPVPYHIGTYECFPFIHFQGRCKALIPDFARGYYELLAKFVGVLQA